MKGVERQLHIKNLLSPIFFNGQLSSLYNCGAMRYTRHSTNLGITYWNMKVT